MFSIARADTRANEQEEWHAKLPLLLDDRQYAMEGLEGLTLIFAFAWEDWLSMAVEKHLPRVLRHLQQHEELLEDKRFCCK
jgi:hypothetical protein